MWGGSIDVVVISLSNHNATIVTIMYHMSQVVTFTLKFTIQVNVFIIVETILR
jgi:hypothetical protein